MIIELLKRKKFIDRNPGIEYTVENLEFHADIMRLYGMMEVGEISEPFYIEIKNSKTDYHFLKGGEKEIPEKLFAALWVFYFNHVIVRSEARKINGKIIINKIIEIK
jgi:hypothetical protein